MIIVALVLVATLVIDMIAGNVIASQMLVIAKAKNTMPNIKANLDQGHDHDHNHCPVLMTL